MQLEKTLSQGELLYLSKYEDAISVNENEHFRWMAFNDIVQSIMHKRRPSKLTLPHQIAMLLPLLIFRPINIVELGLGGGNLSRFLANLSPDIHISSIEYSQQVIDCFNRYFNPENANIDVIHNDGLSWVASQNTEDFDWLICDVYRCKEFGFDAIVKQLEILTQSLNPQACLSINLPDVSDDEINLSLTILQQLQTSHRVSYFHIPNYLNIIIHLHPKHLPIHRLIKRNKHSYLSPTLFNRWCKYWPYGNHL